MISVAGLPFDVQGPFSTGELQLLAALEQLQIPPLTDLTFTLRVTADPPWRPPDVQLAKYGSPAALHFHHDCIRVAHEQVIGEFDVIRRRGSFARYDDSGAPLRIMLRAACTASLPLHGAMPLHACALIEGDRAYVCFGESGAGKTTLAAVSGLSVLSDEIVSITAEQNGLSVRATGFGDEIGHAPAVTKPVQVAALVQLAKGPMFRALRLPRHDVLPQLLKAVLAPPHRLVWTAALDVLRSVLASSVPVVRMEWSPDQPPFRDLADFIQAL